jgi:hypothetical protein
MLGLRVGCPRLSPFWISAASVRGSEVKPYDFQHSIAVDDCQMFSVLVARYSHSPSKIVRPSPRLPPKLDPVLLSHAGRLGPAASVAGQPAHRHTDFHSTFGVCGPVAII